MKDDTPNPTKNTLTFGIYPGSAIGDTELTGPPDRPDKINQALAQLQGSPGRPFIVRAYDIYADPGDTVHAVTLQTPAGYDRYLGHGRLLDLVVQYHSRSGDVDGYCAFIEKLIDNHGEHIATLQIGEEPNISDNPSLDGAYPRVTEALIAGVRTAKDKASRSGHPGLKVGCNSSPLLGPAAPSSPTSPARAASGSSAIWTTSAWTSSLTSSAPSLPPALPASPEASSKPTAATTWPPRGSVTFPW